MVPTRSARLYTQVFTRHRLLAGMPEFSFPRAAWERGVLEYLRIKTSAERGNDAFMFREVITAHILTSFLKDRPRHDIH